MRLGEFWWCHANGLHSDIKTYNLLLSRNIARTSVRCYNWKAVYLNDSRDYCSRLEKRRYFVSVPRNPSKHWRRKLCLGARLLFTVCPQYLPQTRHWHGRKIERKKLVWSLAPGVLKEHSPQITLYFTGVLRDRNWKWYGKILAQYGQVLVSKQKCPRPLSNLSNAKTEQTCYSLANVCMRIAYKQTSVCYIEIYMIVNKS